MRSYLLGLLLVLALHQSTDAAATCCGGDVSFTASAFNGSGGGGISRVDVQCNGSTLLVTLVTAPGCPVGNTTVMVEGSAGVANMFAPPGQLLGGPTCSAGINTSVPWMLQNSSATAPFSASFNVDVASGATCAAVGCETPLLYGTMQQLAAGSPYGQNCGQAVGGAWWCWGNNTYGELADGAQVTPAVLAPVYAVTVSTDATLVVGRYLSCAVLPAGTVQCWGTELLPSDDANAPLVLLDGGYVEDYNSSTGILSGVAALSLGGLHRCAVLSSGSVTCWGARSNGNLGDGNGVTDKGTYVNPVPVQLGSTQGPLTDAIAVAAGYAHTCALLRNASVVCWGWNANGRLGIGSTVPYSAYPQLVSALSNVSSISAGNDNTCAVLSNGQLWCWGYNGEGQLGVGTFADSAVPVPVLVGAGGQPTQNVVGVATGSFPAHTCAWLADGTARCFGDNIAQQLGDYGAAGANSTTPVTVLQQPGGQPLSGIKSMTTTAYGTCALLESGAVNCWGGLDTPTSVYPSGVFVPDHFVQAGTCQLSLSVTSGNGATSAVPSVSSPSISLPSATTASHGASTTGIIAGAVGGLGGLAVLAAIAYIFVFRQRLHADSKTTLLAALHIKDFKDNKDVEQGVLGNACNHAQHPGRDAQDLKSAASDSLPLAATSAPMIAHTGMPLGAPGLGSGSTLRPTAGSTVVTGSLEVPLVVLAVCTQLALAIVDAADRVVANHARCRRLVGRVARMQPLLKQLMDRHLERDPAKVDPLESQLQHIRSVLEDVRSCVSRWCDGSGSMVAVLKNLVTSHWYQQDFVDLNTQLSEAYTDLGLMLGMQSGEANNNDKTQVAVEAQRDLSVDMRQLAEDLTNDTRLWSELNAKQQGQLRAAYAAQGQDLDELARQARRDVVRRKVKDLYIAREHVQLLEPIGAGGYGTVYRAKWQGVEVAVKELSKAVLTQRAQRSLENEGYIMSITRHPNVAQFYGLVVEHGLCALVMRYYPRGSLVHLLHDDNCSLTWSQRCQLALDVARGMEHLHSRPFESIVHGDLKTSNLLIADDGSAVISDFGLSRVQTLTKTLTINGRNSGGGSLTYTAPEVLRNPAYKLTAATDVYSFSMVMYELGTGRMPFDEGNAHVIAYSVQNGGRPEIPGTVPAEYAGLMQRCWAQNPEDRPAFGRIVKVLEALAGKPVPP